MKIQPEATRTSYRSTTDTWQQPTPPSKTTSKYADGGWPRLEALPPSHLLQKSGTLNDHMPTLDFTLTGFFSNLVWEIASLNVDISTPSRSALGHADWTIYIDSPVPHPWYDKETKFVSNRGNGKIMRREEEGDMISKREGEGRGGAGLQISHERPLGMPLMREPEHDYSYCDGPRWQRILTEQRARKCFGTIEWATRITHWLARHYWLAKIGTIWGGDKTFPLPYDTTPMSHVSVLFCFIRWIRLSLS